MDSTKEVSEKLLRSQEDYDFLSDKYQELGENYEYVCTELERLVIVN